MMLPFILVVVKKNAQVHNNNPVLLENNIRSKNKLEVIKVLVNMA